MSPENRDALIGVGYMLAAVAGLIALGEAAKVGDGFGALLIMGAVIVVLVCAMLKPRGRVSPRRSVADPEPIYAEHTTLAEWLPVALLGLLFLLGLYWWAGG